MKKLLLIVIFIIPSIVFAQGFNKRHSGPPREKLEQLERIKLLEVLDLDEETSVRFFTRRRNHKEEMQQIIDKRENLVHEMDEALDNEMNKDEFNYMDKIDELMQIEEEILNSRKEFIYSLNDILNDEQIAEIMVFENKFIKQIRNTLIKHRRNRD